MKNNSYIILFIVWGILLSINLNAQVTKSPRSVSLSGAYATRARGWNSIGWNPANLGYSDTSEISISVIPLNNLTLEAQNNSLSLSRIHNTIYTGENFQNKKDDLFDYIPSSGLQGSMFLDMNMLSISFGNWAFSYDLQSMNNAEIPKGLFEFLLYGNEIGQEGSIDLSGFDLQSQTTTSFTAYHGREVNLNTLNELFGQNFNITDYIENLYLGGGVKFIQGISYINIDQFDAIVTMDTTKASLKGTGIGNAAIGGLGLGLDLGASAQINDKMRTSLSFHNLFGHISWGKIGPEFEGQFGSGDESTTQKGQIFQKEYSIDVEIPTDKIDKADSLLEDGIETDTTITKDNLSSDYPTYMNIGFEYKLQNNLKVFSTYRQYFSDEFGLSYTPLLSLGSEYYPASILPLRAGVAFGGTEIFRWSVGSGIEFNNFCFNFGFSQIGGFFNHSRGFTVSIGSEIKF